MTVLLPAAVADANWFLLASAAPAACVALLLSPPRSLKWPYTSGAFLWLAARRNRAVWLLLLLASLLLVLGAALEAYHARGCPNSDVFQYEVEALARFVLQLNARYELPFWAAFGNLLFVLRGQKRVPVGDTDSDVSVPKRAFLHRFPSMDTFAETVWKEAVAELGRPAFVSYLEDRELVQIYLSEDLTGAHADIWLYTEETDAAGNKWLVNEDRTVRGKRFPVEQVFPLQLAATPFLGEPVTVARNTTYMAMAEYGASFMTPITMRLECIENVVNGYTFYKRKLQMAKSVIMGLMAVLALTLAAASTLKIEGLNVKLSALRGRKKVPRSSDTEESEHLV